MTITYFKRALQLLVVVSVLAVSPPAEPRIIGACWTFLTERLTESGRQKRLDRQKSIIRDSYYTTNGGDEFKTHMLEKYLQHEQSLVWTDAPSKILKFAGAGPSVAKLGSGGFGSVYLGTRNGQRVAFKLYGVDTVDIKGQFEYRNEFYNNQSDLGRLDLEGIPVAKVLDSNNENLALVMEFRRGFPVDTLVEREDMNAEFIDWLQLQSFELDKLMIDLEHSWIPLRNLLFDVDTGQIVIIDPR